MITQPNYPTSRASTTKGRFSVQPNSAAASSPSSEKVAISRTTYELSRSANAGTATQGLGTFSEMAHADPELAEQLASVYAFSLDGPLVHISHLEPQTGKKAIYTATGEPVTEESEAWFNHEAARIREERISLYQSEKEKGTSAAEILDKIIRLMDSQPEKYLQLLNWQKISGRT